MNTPAPVRWSNLRWMRQSPLHYRYFLDHPVSETPAMRLGSIVHAAVFGSQHNFVVFEDARRGNDWKEFQEANADRRIVTRDEYDLGHNIARAVLDCPAAAPLLRGIKERRLTWALDGRECCGTPDLITPAALTDLKVTADARPERFHWQASKMGWLGQIEWYAEGARLAGLPPPRDCYIIAAEPKPPHPVVVYQLTDAAREIGMRTWRLLWERLMVCEQSDAWPGYVESVVPLDVQEQEELTLTVDGEEVEL